MIAWLVVSSMAGELEVERVRTALAEGRSEEALAAARSGLDAGDTSFDAWYALLSSCAAVGIDPACRAEAVLVGTEPATLALGWHDANRKASLGSATLPEGAPELAKELAEVSRLSRANPDLAAERVWALRDSQPAHPDLALPLFDPSLPPQKALTKTRAKVIKAGGKAIPSASPAELHRWHRVFVAGASPLAETSAQALQDAGETRPLARRQYTRAELVTLARDHVATPSDTPPVMVAGEREGFALRLAELLVSAGRMGEAAQVLAASRAEGDTVSLALAHGSALLDGQELPEAEAVANEALALAVAPWPVDVAVTDRISRRKAVSEALALRGRVHLAAKRAAPASVDLMLANQLALQPVATAELERAVDSGWFELEQLKVSLETPQKSAADIALAQAAAALEADPEAALKAADLAVQVLSMPSQRKGRLTARLAGQPELAAALAMRGHAKQRAGRSGVEDLTTAVLLLPWQAPSDWWSALAEARTADQPWAAFFARAMADAMSESSDPAAVAATWPGGAVGGAGAGPALVAAWMVGDKGLEPKKDRLVVERGRITPFRPPRTGGGGKPALNAPFPEWQFNTSTGTMSRRPGRTYMFSVIRSDSPNSLRLATELTDLARDLRKEGADVQWVGVSMDPDRGAFDGIGAQRERWGDTAWDPGFGARLGVSAVPTTWVVDADGIARFQHVGYLGPAEYEAEIRFISGI